MAFKDILLTFTTYPEPTPVSAIDEAVAFAAALGARVSAIACEHNFPVPRSVLGNVLLDIPGMAAAAAKESSMNAQRLLVALQDAAEKQGVFQERILEQCPIEEVPKLFVEYARLRDVTIVSVPEGDFYYQWYSEAIIFGSGHPTLVVPRTRKRAGAFALDTVVVAWDFSQPASRAVADALPILERTKRVCVVTVANEKNIDTKRSGAELSKYLARHGVNVVLDTIDASGQGIGADLDSYVTSRNADLLVMGAYGHRRIREFILGGATRSMLAQPPLPIFLSH